MTLDDLPRHDDLDNPPDFCTLREDYWRLWDAVKGIEIKRKEINEQLSRCFRQNSDTSQETKDISGGEQGVERGI